MWNTRQRSTLDSCADLHTSMPYAAVSFPLVLQCTIWKCPLPLCTSWPCSLSWSWHTIGIKKWVRNFLQYVHKQAENDQIQLTFLFHPPLAHSHLYARVIWKTEFSCHLRPPCNCFYLSVVLLADSVRPSVSTGLSGASGTGQSWKSSASAGVNSASWLPAVSVCAL